MRTPTHTLLLALLCALYLSSHQSMVAEASTTFTVSTIPDGGEQAVACDPSAEPRAGRRFFQRCKETFIRPFQKMTGKQLSQQQEQQKEAAAEAIPNFGYMNPNERFVSGGETDLLLPGPLKATERDGRWDVDEEPSLERLPGFNLPFEPLQPLPTPPPLDVDMALAGLPDQTATSRYPFDRTSQDTLLRTWVVISPETERLIENSPRSSYLTGSVSSRGKRSSNGSVPPPPSQANGKHARSLEEVLNTFKRSRLSDPPIIPPRHTSMMRKRRPTPIMMLHAGVNPILVPQTKKAEEEDEALAPILYTPPSAHTPPQKTMDELFADYQARQLAEAEALELEHQMAVNTPHLRSRFSEDSLLLSEPETASTTSASSWIHGFLSRTGSKRRASVLTPSRTPSSSPLLEKEEEEEAESVYVSPSPIYMSRSRRGESLPTFATPKESEEMVRPASAMSRRYYGKRPMLTRFHSYPSMRADGTSGATMVAPSAPKRTSREVAEFRDLLQEYMEMEPPTTLSAASTVSEMHPLTDIQEEAMPPAYI